MNRMVQIFAGPESAALVVSAAMVSWIRMHKAGSSTAGTSVEGLVWFGPPVIAATVFATGLIPGFRSWGWMARAILVALVASAVVVWSCIQSFGEGARGQDAGLIVGLMTAAVGVSLGTSIASAGLLAGTHPSIGAWFSRHPVLTPVIVLAAAVPIGMVMTTVLATGLGLAGGLWTAFKR